MSEAPDGNLEYSQDIVSHVDLKRGLQTTQNGSRRAGNSFRVNNDKPANYKGTGRAGSRSPHKRQRSSGVERMETVRDELEKTPTKRRSPETPKRRGRPKKVKLELEDELEDDEEHSAVPKIEDTDFKLDESPVKTPRVFASPSKSPSKPILTQSPFKITLNKNFVPTRLPTENDYQAPPERHLTYFFDGFEGYIDQKKPIRKSKKSTHSMAMAPMVTRQQYSLITSVLNSVLHRSRKAKLREIQETMFPQFWFELTQGFSLLFYGVGSKKQLLEDFALKFLSRKLALQLPEVQESSANSTFEGVPCVIVNGYNPTCNYRDVFHSISQIMLPQELSKTETKYWSNHVELQMNKMIEVYQDMPLDVRLILLVHNIDGPALRKDVFQNILSFVSRVRQIALVASADHIHAPLLWDHVRTQNYNFVFHDVTNYENYAIETSFGDAMKIGRSDQGTGAEGARYVLESLTVNSKRMFKLLIENQLASMKSHKKTQATTRGSNPHGIEFKQFYHMCAAEFIASNEISLRTMLREFIEHKMTVISKDRSGVESIYVPYTFAEMEALLRDVLDL
ncbi:LAMI_0C05424g1_1 [Lachancea mirantina]|uniref:Origin recognition complex subunit 2 n=1 Tax=Lachancea mirantina TaxID=1230905 RepID=A0A1G4J2U7_9SACH|nr:LAMI_0C05424g1_1 [Lachancea mirantina]